MKVPNKCPCCDEPLLNEYYELGAEKTSYLRQTCQSKIDHHIIFQSIQGKDNEVAKVIIYIKQSAPTVRAIWDLQRLQLTIVKNGQEIDSSFQKYTEIPFFEPDLSDYSKLLDKLKTYLIFS